MTCILKDKIMACVSAGLWLGLICFAPHSPAGVVEAVATAPTVDTLQRDEVVRRFRVGPLFEYRATRAGGTFWAFRPVYSKINDPISDTRVTDVVWPLCTFHRDHERQWWRIVLGYGYNDDIYNRDAAWTANILPLWFKGHTREGEDYWAFFPFYGHIPHMMWMEDIDFWLFPFYINFEINGVERVYTPWPFYSNLTENPNITERGVFPFWCRQENHKYQIDRLYAFWPFWTSAVYHGERNPGTSTLFFPFYGEVDRAKESQWLVLPPLFSHARTDSAERWHMPWPFYVTHETWLTRSTQPSLKRSYWPFYGSTHQEDGDYRRYAAWPIYWFSTLTTKNSRAERCRIFPFYTDEVIYKRDKAGIEHQAERYTRVWPFYARESTPQETKSRALELNLIRHSGAIERNWAPFWTLYEYHRKPSGTVEHDLLWGLIRWSVAPD